MLCPLNVVLKLNRFVNVTCSFNIRGEYFKAWYFSIPLACCFFTNQLTGFFVPLHNVFSEMYVYKQDRRFRILRFSTVAMWWDGWAELWTVPYCLIYNILFHMFLTRHPSPVTRHPSPATRHPSPVTRHSPPATRAKVLLVKITFMLRAELSVTFELYWESRCHIISPNWLKIGKQTWFGVFNKE